MSSRRRRDSEPEDRVSESADAEEEEEVEGEEETTSKPTRVTDEDPRSLVQRRRKKRKKGDVVDMTSVIGLWAASLKGPHLDLMVSLKQLAEVRLKNSRDESLASCLTPASLRTIGIILEELVKDRMITEYPLADKGLRKGNGDDQLQKGEEGSSCNVGREIRRKQGHNHDVIQ